MMVFLNGEFVPEERAVVSVFDRSFRYGDGVFEAVLVSNGKLFRWAQHFDRLSRSAEFLKIPLSFSSSELREGVQGLVVRNGHSEGMARITLSRGVGPRAYAPSGEEKPTMAITTQPLPPLEVRPMNLIVASLRVAAGDLISQQKTASRLLNVLAAAEARERGADDALLVNTDGHVTEGTSSNVFWIANGSVFTAPVSAGLLPGVTRAIVFDVCEALGVSVIERTAEANALFESDGVFLTFTTRGVVEVATLDGKPLRTNPLVKTLASEYRALVQNECA